MAKIQRSLYEGAPGMLMDRIHEVNALLESSKLKTGETESWKFWKRTSDIMKFSWDYIQNLNWLLREVYHLRSENTYLRDQLRESQEEIYQYTCIRHMKLTGVFEQRVDAVEKMMEYGVDNIEGITRD